MSREALEAVIGRAVIDARFCLALFADPDATLAGYELTEGELAALKTLDAESLEACESIIARGTMMHFLRGSPPAKVR